MLNRSNGSDIAANLARADGYITGTRCSLSCPGPADDLAGSKIAESGKVERRWRIIIEITSRAVSSFG